MRIQWGNGNIYRNPRRLRFYIDRKGISQRGAGLSHWGIFLRKTLSIYHRAPGGQAVLSVWSALESSVPSTVFGMQLVLSKCPLNSTSWPTSHPGPGHWAWENPGKPALPREPVFRLGPRYRPLAFPEHLLCVWLRLAQGRPSLHCQVGESPGGRRRARGVGRGTETRAGRQGLGWAGADQPHAATPTDRGPSSPAPNRVGLLLPLLWFEKLKVRPHPP